MHGSVSYFYLNVQYPHRCRKAKLVPIQGASTHTLALNSPVLRHGRSLYLYRSESSFSFHGTYFFFFFCVGFSILIHTLANSTSMEDIPGILRRCDMQPVSSSSSEK